MEKEYQPRIVEALEGLKVKVVSAGGWHSSCIAG